MEIILTHLPVNARAEGGDQVPSGNCDGRVQNKYPITRGRLRGAIIMMSLISCFF